MASIIEPVDQIVNNTPFFQSEFENDAKFGTGTDASIYLSRLLNLNLDSLLNQNEVSAQVIGFEPSIVNLSNDVVTIQVEQGKAIVDKTLIELNETVQLTIGGNFLFNIADPNHADNIVIVVEYEFKNTLISNNFKINAYLLNSTNNNTSAPIITWNNTTHNFILGVFKFYRDTDTNLVAFDLLITQSNQKDKSDCLTLFNANIGNTVTTSIVLETGDNINFGANPKCGSSGGEIPWAIIDIINFEEIIVTQDLADQTKLDADCLALEVAALNTCVTNVAAATGNGITGEVASLYHRECLTNINIGGTPYTVFPRTNTYDQFKGKVNALP